MKVSLNWAQDHSNIDLLQDSNVSDLVDKIGGQLGAVEEVTDLGKKYQGIKIAKVVHCEKHPNADKLSLCLIDDGGQVENVKRDKNGYVQVVCGAPNVRQDMLVAWLPPGVTVPASFGRDPFVLEARELRGEISNGMLASAQELAISDDHSGIVELDDKEFKSGDDFAKAMKLNDHIIDIENKMFTHRPDCFGILGVAREIAGITHQSFSSPKWYTERPSFSPKSSKMTVEVKNELPELVSRFMAAPMSGVNIAASPLWLQSYLSRVGIRPVNNVVDLTNYYMHLTGQPTHAYDYDKLLALDHADRSVLTVRRPKKGEKLQLLSGKSIEPRSEAIMIASAKQLIGVGGVMGGMETEVDDTTKNIVIECATFDMYSIRRTAMEHGLFTDAVTRFTKGQSPLQNDRVLAKLIDDIRRLTGGELAGVVVDDKHLPEQLKHVVTTSEFVNARLGLELSASEMQKLLKNVEFNVSVQGSTLYVEAPFWRTDIEIAEDVVEEIGRLYGFDKLPLILPRRDLSPAAKNGGLELKQEIRNALSLAGANEVLSYSFVHGDLLGKVGQDKQLAYKLSNALSPDLQYYRLSMIPSLLENVHTNIKAGYDEFALYEIGKVHSKSEVDADKLPKEFDRLALVYAANDKTAQNYEGAAFFQAKKYASELGRYNFVPLEKVNLEGHELSMQMVAPFEPRRSAALYLNDKFVGVVGEFAPAVTASLKLPKFAAGFEIFLSGIAKHHTDYQALPKFPKAEQDISLRVASEISYQDLYELVAAALAADAPANTRVVLNPLDIYQAAGDKANKHVTFRLSVASYERTLTAEEVNSLLDKAAEKARKQFNASRI